MLNPSQRQDLLGLALLTLALFLLLSLVPEAAVRLVDVFPSGNVMGSLGARIRDWGYRFLGLGIPVVVLLPALGGAVCFGWLDRARAVRWGGLGLGLALLAPIGLSLIPWSGASPAGWLGTSLGEPLRQVLGWLGTALTLVFLTVALFVATIGWNPAPMLARGGLWAGRMLRDGARRGWAAAKTTVMGRRVQQTPAVAVGADPEPAVVDMASPPEPAKRRLGVLARKPKRAPDVDLEDPGDPDSADRPPLPLLSAPPETDASLSEQELDRLGNVLIETLRTFKVEGRVGGRTTGPVVTQFEVVPAPGVKVNRIAALDADLALALKAPSVRIVAPIPGKGAVGVEVPNPEPEVVYLREILETPEFRRGRAELPLALGKDLTGRPYVADLARMPHLLIAGATGSGKSVCINTIITSLIYRHPPQRLRMLLIDPKMVELSMYGDLPHLRHPVVTDPKDAAVVLKWAVYEMERRYELLKENGCRSIAEFNRRIAEGVVIRLPAPDGEEGDPDRWIYRDGPLPYIVVVVDELADLMMAVQAEIEKPLAQLAQKARAIGIHLIVATQRPSVNVITGLIKANFPCRIAFRVSSKVDSRTILDQNGADALLGNGDMLFLPPGQSDPVRIQGAFLPTEDTEQVMAWYRDRDRVRSDAEEDILEYVRAREAEEAGSEAAESFAEDRDPLFMQAAEVCIQFQQGSTSLLQRRLRIGYGRAARIIDQLHTAGILGPPDGSKPREVLVGYEALHGLEAGE